MAESNCAAILNSGKSKLAAILISGKSKLPTILYSGESNTVAPLFNIVTYYSGKSNLINLKNSLGS